MVRTAYCGVGRRLARSFCEEAYIVIDEGSQLRRYSPVAGIVEKPPGAIGANAVVWRRSFLRAAARLRAGTRRQKIQPIGADSDGDRANPELAKFSLEFKSTNFWRIGETVLHRA
jgi:hypothetical protein